MTVSLHNNIDLLRSAVQLESTEYTREIKAAIELLSRNKIIKPLILISSGTSSKVAGSEKTYKAVTEYIADRNIDAEIIRTGSLGICNMEPVLSIQLPGRARISFVNITMEKVTPLLDDVFHNTIPSEYLLGQHRNSNHDAWLDIPFIDELPFFKHQHRIILKDSGIINPDDIFEYIARGGYHSFLKAIRNFTYDEVCDIVEKSGLRGRSGSGFNTGKKWKIANNTYSDQKYLICNAEESDPGAFMDRAIMEGNPHLLLEGMAIAAYGIGTSKAFIYIRTEYKEAIGKLENAIKSAKEAGILGYNIFGSGYNLDIVIKKDQAHLYVVKKQH